jgi:hypothetical protein
MTKDEGSSNDQITGQPLVVPPRHSDFVIPSLLDIRH